MALHEEEIAKQGFVICAINEYGDALWVKTINLHIKRLADHLRPERAIVCGKHAHVCGQAVVELHVPDGNHAVEPNVCRLINELLIDCLILFRAHVLKAFQKLGTLAFFLSVQEPTFHHINGGRLVAVRSYAKALGLDGNLGNELSARPDAEVFNGGIVHGMILGVLSDADGVIFCKCGSELFSDGCQICINVRF